MNSNLLIPINVQALCIGREDSKQNIFTNQDVDFKNLPHKDEDGSYHPIDGAANISDGILAPKDITLEQGVHIHWTLPDAINHGKVQNHDIEFPSVPDRWLVARISDNTNLNKFWIVESNYLSDEEQIKDANSYFTEYSAAIPYNYGEDYTKPYKYLGAVTDDIINWREKRQDKIPDP
ncbi:MAG: hypothetical protein EOP34_08610, partial [Rickettsiales bacterium]